jgi:hypothetical protein
VRQGFGSSDGFPDPSAQRLSLQAVGLNRDEAAHRSTGEVHRAGVRSGERFLLARWIETHDQFVAVYAAAHVAADHECQPAEHLSLADVGSLGQECANTGGKSIVVCHAYSGSVRGRPKERKTLVSGKPVIAVIWLLLSVSTISP